MVSDSPPVIPWLFLPAQTMHWDILIYMAVISMGLQVGRFQHRGHQCRLFQARNLHHGQALVYHRLIPFTQKPQVGQLMWLAEHLLPDLLLVRFAEYLLPQGLYLVLQVGQQTL